MGALAAMIPYSHHNAHHSVTLTWHAAVEQPGERIVSYSIYRSTAPGGPCAPRASVVKALSYRDELVTAGTTYYYTVKSVDQSGQESGPSKEVQVTVPAR